MDSFFLAEPIDLSEVKAKNKTSNPKNFRKYQLLPKTQTLLHKENVAHGKYGKNMAKSSPRDSVSFHVKF